MKPLTPCPICGGHRTRPDSQTDSRNCGARLMWLTRSREAAALVAKKVFGASIDQAKAAAKIGRATSKATAPGPGHPAAKVWSIRSSKLAVYQFRNLRDFVRRNAELFDPNDIKKRRIGKYRLTCNAYGGLASLSPNVAYPRLSWKGWTWVSIHERRFNDGEDLLERKAA